jgi:hypothetical protein
MSFQTANRTITSECEVIVGAKCDNCGAELEPVGIGEDGAWRSAQAKDALVLILDGGYGEYFDGNASVVLCRGCADALCGAFPLLKAAISQADFAC